MVDIEQFLPRPHPLKSIFKQRQIPQIAVRNYLQARLNISVSQSLVAHWLNGYTSIPEHVEAELETLAGQVSSPGGQT